VGRLPASDPEVGGPRVILAMAHTTFSRARVLLAAGLAVALSAVVLAGTTSAATKTPVRVTFIGDSVPASIMYSPRAKSILARGLATRLDLRVCRRLATASCSYQGSAPTSALQSVQALGRSLGDVLIVDVGYNESASGYRDGIDRIMRAARAQGAAGVVWVLLRETRDIYRQTNAVIRSAQKRWPDMLVADWNAYSRGKPWFSSDGLHMGVTGADALAAFVRPYVFRAAAA
jgi:hypothetical protein